MRSRGQARGRVALHGPNRWHPLPAIAASRATHVPERPLALVRWRGLAHAVHGAWSGRHMACMETAAGKHEAGGHAPGGEERKPPASLPTVADASSVVTHLTGPQAAPRLLGRIDSPPSARRRETYAHDCGCQNCWRVGIPNPAPDRHLRQVVSDARLQCSARRRAPSVWYPTARASASGACPGCGLAPTRRLGNRTKFSAGGVRRRSHRHSPTPAWPSARCARSRLPRAQLGAHQLSPRAGRG
jgi:hypothetical protein